MPIFCTKCGTKNEDGASFCEGCGASVLKPKSVAPHQEAATAVQALPPSPRSRTVLYAGLAITTLLLIGGGAAYVALTPPTATSAKLLAAAKIGYEKTLAQQVKRELCLSNMNYGLEKFNVGENDQGTQTWLNTLVSAGLYSPAVPISSGGYFPQTLYQYIPTPELAKWREGSRLCLAKELEIVDVVDIEPPQEQAVAGHAGASKVLTVKANLLLQTTGAAPWLENAEVRDAILKRVDGWEYKNTKLQKKTADIFGLRDKQWTTGQAYKAELQQQQRAALRGNGEAGVSAKSSGFFSGLGNAFSSIFDFGGHPLKGTWRMDTEAMGNALGMKLPSGLGIDATLTFTADSIDAGGLSSKCKFEVDGQKIKVTPEGQATSLVFVMQDKDTASLDMGLFKVQYKRVN